MTGSLPVAPAAARDAGRFPPDLEQDGPLTDRGTPARHSSVVPVHAPAPRAVDGLLAVPVHVQQLTADVVLDADNRSGVADATLRFRVGPTSGCPLFDLRQSIDQAWLDGRPLATARVRPRSVGEGPHGTIRVLDLPQAAASAHTLRLRYRLGRPRSDLGGAYPPVLATRGPGRLRWSFGMADLFDGRHLEMWFPSNLPFDQFPFELAVTLTGVQTPHSVITNGDVTDAGAGSWRIRFPAWCSSVSQMLELWPTDELDHARREVALSGSGRAVAIDAWKVKGRPEDLASESARIGRLLERNEAIFGSVGLERYTCFFHGAEGGMEYAAATTTSSGALAHEVLHSWFARGAMPASDADGWWDEAFTTYVTQGAVPAPLDFRRPPTQLCSRRPFQRHTDAAAYRDGSRLFEGLAAMAGSTPILRAMGRLVRARRRTCVSTAELEEHLVLETGAVTVVDAFHRFVYGFDDPRPGLRVCFDRLWMSDGTDGHPWISAQVSNRGAEVCRHFLLLFSLVRRGGDPAREDVATTVAAAAGFDLQPGRTRVVRVRAPLALVPPEDLGADSALVAVVGGVHVRLAHPSGAAGDYRDRAMMRTNLMRSAGPPEWALATSAGC